ncbi:MAG: MBL fold metallo-hydrolase [Bacteroidales bacterium]|nr:MBL fold metallo-hydrolase [Bacteroidales bacterium]
MDLKITFLGTGTSQGVPMIACPCRVCTSVNPRDNRLRSSVFIETENKKILIDAGPDFRYQMLRAEIKKLDAILLTHEHRDHIAGLDDVRGFNYFQEKPVELYAENRVIKEVENVFSYAFGEDKYPGAPDINLNPIENGEFLIGSLSVIPIRVSHYQLPIFGYRIGPFAYITDANGIDHTELEKLRNLDTLVLNALRPQPHISHFNLREALQVIAQVRPKRAYLTHVGHQMGLFEEIQPTLPSGVSLAWDGLVIHIH